MSLDINDKIRPTDTFSVTELKNSSVYLLQDATHKLIIKCEVLGTPEAFRLNKKFMKVLGGNDTLMKLLTDEEKRILLAVWAPTKPTRPAGAWASAQPKGRPTWISARPQASSQKPDAKELAARQGLADTLREKPIAYKMPFLPGLQTFLAFGRRITRRSCKRAK